MLNKMEVSHLPPAFDKATTGEARQDLRRLFTEASAKEDKRLTKYFYILRSINHPDQTYVGISKDYKKPKRLTLISKPDQEEHSDY